MLEAVADGHVAEVLAMENVAGCATTFDPGLGGRSVRRGGLAVPAHGGGPLRLFGSVLVAGAGAGHHEHLSQLGCRASRRRRATGAISAACFRRSEQEREHVLCNDRPRLGGVRGARAVRASRLARRRGRPDRHGREARPSVRHRRRRAHGALGSADSRARTASWAPSSSLRITRRCTCWWTAWSASSALDIASGREVFRADLSTPDERVKSFFSMVLTPDGQGTHRARAAHQAPAERVRGEKTRASPCTAPMRGSRPSPCAPSPRRAACTCC